MVVYTTNELADKCDVPFYTIQYLAKCGRIKPAVKGKRGKGALYAEDCVQIVLNHKKGIK